MKNSSQSFYIILILKIGILLCTVYYSRYCIQTVPYNVLLYTAVHTVQYVLCSALCGLQSAKLLMMYNNSIIYTLYCRHSSSSIQREYVQYTVRVLCTIIVQQEAVTGFFPKA